MVSWIWKGPTWTIQLLLICSYLVKLVRYLSTIKTWRSFPLDQSCTWRDLVLKKSVMLWIDFLGVYITFWVAVFYFWKGYLPSHFPPCFETCLIIYGPNLEVVTLRFAAANFQAAYQAVHHMSYIHKKLLPQRNISWYWLRVHCNPGKKKGLRETRLI